MYAAVILLARQTHEIKLYTMYFLFQKLELVSEYISTALCIYIYIIIIIIIIFVHFINIWESGIERQ